MQLECIPRTTVGTITFLLEHVQIEFITIVGFVLRLPLVLHTAQ